jgi:hypothetical protein
MIDLTLDDEESSSISSSSSDVEIIEPQNMQHHIALSPEIFEYINNDEILQYLERKYGVKLFLKNNNLFIDPVTNSYAGHIFEDYMNSLDIVGFNELKTNITKRKNEKVHIFIDHSNICCRYHFNVRDFLNALVDLRDVRKIALVGSTANSNDNKFDIWRDCGCDITIIGRDPRTHKEIGVDDVLHGLILCEAAREYNETHTIIILTGDGNMNNGQCSSFPVVVEEILKKNKDKVSWKVELWTWKDQTSHVYRKFQQEYELFSLLYIDEVVQYEAMTDSRTSRYDTYESHNDYISARNYERFNSPRRKRKKKVKKSSTKKHKEDRYFSDYGNSTAVIKKILKVQEPSRSSSTSSKITLKKV